jgi:hypothetical protein
MKGAAMPWFDLLYFVGFGLLLKYLDKTGRLTWTRLVLTGVATYALLLLARSAPPLPDWGLLIFFMGIVLAICVWAVRTAKEFR